MGRAVSRALVLTALEAETAVRNKVSSTGSAPPFSRDAAMAVLTWVTIWSSPQIWDRSPAATRARCLTAASSRRVTKAWAKGA